MSINYHELRQEYRVKRKVVQGVWIMGFIWATVAVVTLLFLSGCDVANASVGVNSYPLGHLVDLNVIAQIESSGSINAYNKRTGATGLYQITPICLKDYNQFHKDKRSMSEMYDPYFAQMVASWYLNIRIPQLLIHYKLPVTVRNILWAYNAGIGNVVKKRMPKETQDYIVKYENLKNI